MFEQTRCHSGITEIPGTTAPSAPNLNLCSSGSKAHGKVDGHLKGAVSAQKSLQGSKSTIRELLLGMEESSLASTWGHCFALHPNF